MIKKNTGKESNQWNWSFKMFWCKFIVVIMYIYTLMLGIKAWFFKAIIIYEHIYNQYGFKY